MIRDKDLNKIPAFIKQSNKIDEIKQNRVRLNQGFPILISKHKVNAKIAFVDRL